MTRWFNRRTLTAVLLITGAAMLEGCACEPNGLSAACGSQGYVAPIDNHGGEGGGNGGGGMM